MATLTSLFKDSNRNKKSAKAVAKTAIGLAASFTLTVVGVACLTAFYCKSLMDVSYLGDTDVYDEE